MKIKVSTCMIVKNEEQFLDKCLESVKRFSDEIIVVDTGSTDKTVEIAKKHTDKIYHFEWVNDFSKARNYSMSFAKNKWIFIIDGDEHITVPMQDKIIHFLDNFEDIGVNVYSFRSINPHPNKKEIELFYRDTLIYNSPDIFFVKPVHQYIDGKNIIRKTLPFEIINNKNYRDKEISEEKLNNYFNLMYQEIEKSQNNYDKAHFLKHLVWDYEEAGLIDKALETAYFLYNLYSKMNYPKNTSDYFNLMMRILRNELNKNNHLNNSLEFIKEAENVDKRNCFVLFYKGVYYKTFDKKQAEMYLNKAFFLLTKDYPKYLKQEILEQLYEIQNS